MSSNGQIVALVAGQAPAPVLCRLDGGTTAIYSVTVNNANSPVPAFLYPNHNSAVDIPITVPAFSHQTIPLPGVKNCYVTYPAPLTNGSSQLKWDDDQTKTASGFIANTSQYPAGSTAFSIQSSIGFTTATLHNIGSTTVVAGQSVYVSRLKSYGMFRQSMGFTINLTIPGGGFAWSHNSGTDIEFNASPPAQIGPSNAAGAAQFSCTPEDAAVGTLLADFEITGYVL